MYKLLVVTFFSQYRKSLHSKVISFNRKEDAEIALLCIHNQNSTKLQWEVVRLYNV